MGLKLKLFRGRKEDYEKQVRMMTLTQQRRYLSLTRSSFYIFFTANGIVSYRDFIPSSFYVRFK